MARDEELRTVRARALALPPEARRQLADELEASLVPDWHLEAVRKGRAELDADPGSAIPWDEVRAKVWPDG